MSSNDPPDFFGEHQDGQSLSGFMFTELAFRMKSARGFKRAHFETMKAWLYFDIAELLSEFRNATKDVEVIEHDGAEHDDDENDNEGH
jgi:hypothetical protein